MRMPYTIGELARATGVHVETIRHYHRRGLLAEPYRPMGGVRNYEEGHVHRLRFIQRAQALGFDLDEVAELLALEHDRRGAEHIVTRKLAIVRRRIADLRRIERTLAALDEEHHGKRGKKYPPLIDALTVEDANDHSSGRAAARSVRRGPRTSGGSD